jgi:hypothetical protein
MSYWFRIHAAEQKEKKAIMRHQKYFSPLSLFKWPIVMYTATATAVDKTGSRVNMNKLLDEQDLWTKERACIAHVRDILSREGRLSVPPSLFLLSRVTAMHRIVCFQPSTILPLFCSCGPFLPFDFRNDRQVTKSFI